MTKENVEINSGVNRWSDVFCEEGEVMEEVKIVRMPHSWKDGVGAAGGGR